MRQPNAATMAVTDPGLRGATVDDTTMNGIGPTRTGQGARNAKSPQLGEAYAAPTTKPPT